MTTIAQLSDLHLVEEHHARRDAAGRARLSFLSFGRRLDPRGRRERVARALLRARVEGARHVVITGDLTEDGHADQFELLAEVLSESGFAPSAVTLVPGNHDAYSGAYAFARALRGPLRPWADTSASAEPVELPGVMLVPLSSAVEQPIARSAGAIAPRHLDRLAAHARDARARGLALVIAVHHPPEPHVLLPLQWLDGLRDHAALLRVLGAHDHAYLLHGHTHVARDRAVRSGASARIFSTEAVVDGATPLRLYVARHGRVWPEPERLGLAVRALASSF